MSIIEFGNAVHYSWATWNLRRSDLPYRDNKNKDKDVINWDQSKFSKVK